MRENTISQDQLVRQIKQLFRSLDRNHSNALQSWVISQNTRSIVRPLVRLIQKVTSPNMTLKEISKELGVTRQALGQLLKEEE